MKNLTLFFLFGTAPLLLLAQDPPDTLQLGEVVVRAFEQDQRLKNTPASIHYLGQQALEKTSRQSLLPAINMLPGARMEERSPGSYRLNLRGSSLKSPFGVRNIKLYYNQVPFTDPGGISYLNQLSPQLFRSLEIIKGPGSSIYGAGTGGAVLINSIPATTNNYLEAGYSQGSFGYRSLHVDGQFGKDSVFHHITFQHQKADGYRQHTSLERNLAAYDISYRQKDHSLQAFLLAGHLYYQTPGALTRQEFEMDPQQARPRVGNTPGAIENKAAIRQQMLLAGIHHRYKISENWNTRVSFYGNLVQLTNPTIRNYEQSVLPHGGTRFSINYQNKGINWVSGIEWQKGMSQVRTFRNMQGQRAELLTDDEITNRQHFYFTQFSGEIKNWIITAGLSINNGKNTIERFIDPQGDPGSYRYREVLAPRLAILKKFSNQLSAYASIGRGFTPPSIAEIFPSGGTVNLSLQAETGINYEAGARFSTMDNRFYTEISAFYFQLKNALVQRRDAMGGDYFINAGGTDQKGIEWLFNYDLLRNSAGIIKNLNLAGSYATFFFKYKDFKSATADFSGNQLPGIPGHSGSLQLSVDLVKDIYLHVNSYFMDRIFLNDANKEEANGYTLLNLKAGWHITAKNKLKINLFAGVENLLNKRFSLGDDINGFGGRYYNAAPGIGYVGGISFRL